MLVRDFALDPSALLPSTSSSHGILQKLDWRGKESKLLLVDVSLEVASGKLIMGTQSLPSSHLLCLLMAIFLSGIHHSWQLEPSQSQALVKIRQLLYNPSVVSIWDSRPDICDLDQLESSSHSLTLACYEDSITQLHIIGNDEPLPQNFSADSFFAALTSLPNLKVLSLVSLGMWGPLPTVTGNLSSLEILNLTSNYFNATIPVQVSSLKTSKRYSLPLLAVLSLKNNSFHGTLPDSLSNLRNIRILDLSMNHLSGQVPDLRNLTNLQVLDIQDNFFGPQFPSLHTKLVALVLRNNQFHSGIPVELSYYYQLQKLDISFNVFVGPFLPSLLSLPSITYLDVAKNRFTGMLFPNMSCNPQLALVNLSSNLLTGDLPPCLQSAPKSRVVVYERNCLSSGDQVQHPYSFCRIEAMAVKILPHMHKEERRPFSKAVLASIIVGVIVGVVALVGLNTAKTPATRLPSEQFSTVDAAKLIFDARNISQTMKLGALGLPAYRTFFLEELKEATNNFDESSLIEGSHGQIYKGKLTDGTIVGIRSLQMRRRQRQSYMHHIELISKLRHSHLVSALGHCFECFPDDSCVSRIFLITESIPNGTLRGCISGNRRQRLNWTQRIAAAIGVVKGIQFLHTGIVPGLFSNNLKITDVLLDHNLHVKISSYNLLSFQVGVGVSSSGLKGNAQARGKDGDKNDVYDLGVILLEIIVGRPITSKNDVVVARDLLIVGMKADDIARKTIMDPAVGKEWSGESIKTLMEICIRCLHNEPSERPSVEDVLWNLQFAAQVQDSWRGEPQSNRQSPDFLHYCETLERTTPS
ncbi:hypothetical protein AAG906_018960 [Vitis piasezkii]